VSSGSPAGGSRRRPSAKREPDGSQALGLTHHGRAAPVGCEESGLIGSVPSGSPAGGSRRRPSAKREPDGSQALGLSHHGGILHYVLRQLAAKKAA
jgi:hypothetical protein